MSASGHSDETLDVLIQRITNPLSSTYDPKLVYTFCERVKQQQDGPVAATRLLAYRVQSPQEREAMLALDLLDTCARAGGTRFQAELGKFRFLNELIKLLSPRYLGGRTSQRVKQRVADLLLLWSRQIPHETKIGEAFALLQSQGLLDVNGITPRTTGGAAAWTDDELTVPEARDAVALDPHRAPTPPLPSSDRRQNPIFEDGQKAALLKRLLQSTNPEDIQAANRLIKTMVKQDEERTERVSRRVTELETVHSNLRLLEEMMDNFSPDTTSSEELELMTELCTSCQQLRGKLDSIAAETDDQDSALAELVSASERIGEALARHRQLCSTDAPLTLLHLESPSHEGRRTAEAAGQSTSADVLRVQLDRLGLSDSALGSGAASSVSPTGLPTDLLSQPVASAAPVPSATPTSVFSAPIAASAATSSTARPAAPGSNLAELLESLSGPPASSAQQQQMPPPTPPLPTAAGLMGMTSYQPRPMQMLPTSTPAAVPPAVVAATKSPFDDLDDLVRRSMKTSTASAAASTAEKSFSTASSSLLTNQSSASSVSPRPAPAATNQTPPLSPARVTGAESNGHRPITDLLGDDVSLLSALSGPSSHDSLLSETGLGGGQTGSGLGQTASAAGQTASAAGQTASAAGQTASAGGRSDPAAAGDAVRRPASLADLTVRLEDITPGGGAPLALFHEPGSLEVRLHPASLTSPRCDVTAYVITALNSTGRPVSRYALHAACDKTARVRVQPPSSSELAAGSPFLPPPAVSQVMLLATPDPQTSVRVQFMLSYSIDDDIITETAEATLPSQS